MGTDGLGHRLVQQLGHSMHPLYPALTPLRGSHPAEGQLAGKPLIPASAYVHDSQCSQSSMHLNRCGALTDQQARIGQLARVLTLYRCQSTKLVKMQGSYDDD